MAEMRYLSTSIWHEEYVKTLDAELMLLFVYLHLNAEISYYGVMEYNLRRIADETRLDEELVEEMLTEFENSDKILIRNHKIFVRGFSKRITQAHRRAVNKITKKALDSNSYNLHTDIFEAVQVEIDEIEAEAEAYQKSKKNDLRAGVDK